MLDKNENLYYNKDNKKQETKNQNNKLRRTVQWDKKWIVKRKNRKEKEVI